ncbi:hypothetical protein [Paenibacillus apiarius]|uniref:Uncharacterized protein n=1 Tax=Paenibacillus apiarius TaxID=46240 RepID=A0ABT4DW21_9BACL|nr:hypothetical protein [Paenibacillus apiarius]MCY9513090.1 hypothetical protein [Paenibacillus apiarius]MCY9521552.1 hypothetical protein [Paenibacillus apiarius]MCY9551706.1 hypothetical protein [Paenibacillus apiarius]MCY9560506.1 hypothetical protein [Paenibacillus apiarius]MCY9685244.1 hypothetical protein [Paenibacillus apiarius]
MNEQQNRTVLGLSPLDKFLCWVVPPLVGLVIGWVFAKKAEQLQFPPRFSTGTSTQKKVIVTTNKAGAI